MLFAKHGHGCNNCSYWWPMQSPLCLSIQSKPSFSNNICTKRISFCVENFNECGEQHRDILRLCSTSKGNKSLPVSNLVYHKSTRNTGFGNSTQCHPTNVEFYLWWNCFNRKFEPHCTNNVVSFSNFGVMRIKFAVCRLQVIKLDWKRVFLQN